ncbi:cytochrome P450 family protein [Tieghemostelium lacteum]|uniref:Cytochrome P450 family protein n=1 Tax=Tieghemostelium lacteum TaxID=361077 RepID=A0A151ZCW7_TIELA|nr:cytochrome P450 family protein [Tieghemostelium lacteum]|eukprot:KYQ91798.1 cytochrome P450 family protein [Tieghemostelium lacteum]
MIFYIVLIVIGYVLLQWLVSLRARSLVHPLKGQMNGIKPWFIFIGDFVFSLLNIKPSELNGMGEIYYRWFFWNPVIEVRCVETLDYIFNEKYNNYIRYWNMGRSSNQLLFKGGDIKRYARIYQQCLNNDRYLKKLFKVVVRESEVFSKSLQGVQEISGDKEIHQFMLKVLANVYMGYSKEAVECMNATYEKFGGGFKEFLYFLCPKLVLLNPEYISKYNHYRNQRSLFKLIAMKAYYGVNSDHHQREHCLLNFAAEASYNDKEGMSLNEFQLSNFILNVSSVTSPIKVLNSFINVVSKHPEVEIKLRDEIQSILGDSKHMEYEQLEQFKYFDKVLEEVLRLHPPIRNLVPRTLKDSDRLLGYHIPQGSVVSVPVGEILRQPCYYSQPNTFNPDRFSGPNSEDSDDDTEFPTPPLNNNLTNRERDLLKNLPWGIGSTQCSGKKLSILIIKTILIQLYSRYHFKLNQDDCELSDTLLNYCKKLFRINPISTSKYSIISTTDKI